MKTWPIHIVMEPEREIEDYFAGDDVKSALIAALEEIELQPGETIHYIHIGRGIEVNT